MTGITTLLSWISFTWSQAFWKKDILVYAKRPVNETYVLHKPVLLSPPLSWCHSNGTPKMIQPYHCHSSDPLLLATDMEKVTFSEHEFPVDKDRFATVQVSLNDPPRAFFIIGQWQQTAEGSGTTQMNTSISTWLNSNIWQDCFCLELQSHRLNLKSNICCAACFFAWSNYRRTHLATIRRWFSHDRQEKFTKIEFSYDLQMFESLKAFSNRWPYWRKPMGFCRRPPRKSKWTNWRKPWTARCWP